MEDCAALPPPRAQLPRSPTMPALPGVGDDATLAREYTELLPFLRRLRENNPDLLRTLPAAVERRLTTPVLLGEYF